MNNSLEILFLRRPRIDYISPPICEALFSSSGGPVIVLNPLTPQAFPTGLILGGAGGFQLSWDSYPGALCYSVYKADSADPFGSYTVIAECIPNPTFDLTPFGPGDYRVTAITRNGETPLSLPIHFGGSPVTCPFVAGTAPENPVQVETGDDATIGPIPVNEGSGAGLIFYEWFKDGNPYLDTSLTTKNSLTIENAMPADSGEYSLRVSAEDDACDFSFSEMVELQVQAPTVEVVDLIATFDLSP